MECKRTTNQIETLSVLGCPVLTLGSATKYKPRSLGCGSEGSDISNTSALNSENGEEEGQENGDETCQRHVVLDTKDNAASDDTGG